MTKRDMDTVAFGIAPEVFDAHPEYRWGLLVFDDVDNRGDSTALQTLLRAAEAGVRASVSGAVTDHPVVAAWRDAFRRFGAKPSEHRSSIEAMIRRVLKPDALPSIQPLVDIGNIVSLRQLLPIGVHPLGAGARSIELRAARSGDRFAPADGGPDETPPAGEIVLADGDRVLTRRWVWRQAAGTQVVRDTRRVFVNIDGLPPAGGQAVEHAMRDLVELVGTYCGAAPVFHDILGAAHPRARAALT